MRPSNMTPITKKSSYKIEIWNCEKEHRFVNMILTFCSEYGCNDYEFRYDSKFEIIELCGNDFKYHTAYKNPRFKLLAECLYMSQTKLIEKLKIKAQIELSYQILPF